MQPCLPIRADGPIRLALIDDDASVRNGVCRLARSHGLLCTSYESGESALRAPSLGQADCIILDVHLSGMDGFETRDRLRELGLTMPVIFITAHAELNSPEWQRRLRESPCLSKPFEEADLVGTIDRMIKKR